MTRPSRRRSSAPGRAWPRAQLAESGAWDQQVLPAGSAGGGNGTLSNLCIKIILGGREARGRGLKGSVLCLGSGGQFPPNP